MKPSANCHLWIYGCLEPANHKKPPPMPYSVGNVYEASGRRDSIFSHHYKNFKNIEKFKEEYGKHPLSHHLDSIITSTSGLKIWKYTANFSSFAFGRRGTKGRMWTFPSGKRLLGFCKTSSAAKRMESLHGQKEAPQIWRRHFNTEAPISTVTTWHWATAAILHPYTRPPPNKHQLPVASAALGQTTRIKTYTASKKEVSEKC